jgi:hypothetical protein
MFYFREPRFKGLYRTPPEYLSPRLTTEPPQPEHPSDEQGPPTLHGEGFLL